MTLAQYGAFLIPYWGWPIVEQSLLRFIVRDIIGLRSAPIEGRTMRPLYTKNQKTFEYVYLLLLVEMLESGVEL